MCADLAAVLSAGRAAVQTRHTRGGRHESPWTAATRSFLCILKRVSYLLFIQRYSYCHYCTVNADDSRRVYRVYEYVLYTLLTHGTTVHVEISDRSVGLPCARGATSRPASASRPVVGRAVARWPLPMAVCAPWLLGVCRLYVPYRTQQYGTLVRPLSSRLACGNRTRTARTRLRTCVFRI